VGAVVIVTIAALLLIILWKCKRNTKGIASSTSDYVTYDNYDSSFEPVVYYTSVEPPGENVYTKRYVYKQYLNISY